MLRPLFAIFTDTWPRENQLTPRSRKVARVSDLDRDSIRHLAHQSCFSKSHSTVVLFQRKLLNRWFINKSLSDEQPLGLVFNELFSRILHRLSEEPATQREQINKLLDRQDLPADVMELLKSLKSDQ